MELFFLVFSDIATFGHKAITNGSTQCNKTTTALQQAKSQNRCGENYLSDFCSLLYPLQKKDI